MPASRRTRGARGATRRVASAGLRSSLVALLNSHADLNHARSFLSRIQGPGAEGPLVVHGSFPRKDASENYVIAFYIGGAYDDNLPQKMMVITAHKDGSIFTSADIAFGNKMIPDIYKHSYPDEVGHVAAIGAELSKATGQVFGLRF